MRETTRVWWWDANGDGSLNLGRSSSTPGVAAAAAAAAAAASAASPPESTN